MDVFILMAILFRGRFQKKEGGDDNLDGLMCIYMLVVDLMLDDHDIMSEKMKVRVDPKCQYSEKYCYYSRNNKKLETSNKYIIIVSNKTYGSPILDQIVPYLDNLGVIDLYGSHEILYIDGEQRGYATEILCSTFQKHVGELLADADVRWLD
ncbi:hypothetical protein ACJX0J_016566 [Zea mays]